MLPDCAKSFEGKEAIMLKDCGRPARVSTFQRTRASRKHESVSRRRSEDLSFVAFYNDLVEGIDRR